MSEMSWVELSNLVRAGKAKKLFPEGSLISLPVKGEPVLFRVVRHLEKEDGPSELTIVQERLYEPTPIKAFFNTLTRDRDEEDAMMRFNKHYNATHPKKEKNDTAFGST